jgi:chemosensory pili system protein ChpC
MAQAEAKKAEIEVRSQLIPLDGLYLILPNTAIAEVISYSSPDPGESDVDWLLGTLIWRGTTVPVVTFETMHEEKTIKPSKRSRIIILNTISGNDLMPFYGILAQGIPRLMNITESTIHDAPNVDGKSNAYVLRHTIIDSQQVIIPDQKALEETIQTQWTRQ